MQGTSEPIWVLFHTSVLSRIFYFSFVPIEDRITFILSAGYDNASIHGIRQHEALRMLAEVKDFILQTGDVNAANEVQVTLVLTNII